MNCVIIELGLHLCADALNAIWQNLIPNKRVPTAFFFHKPMKFYAPTIKYD